LFFQELEQLREELRAFKLQNESKQEDTQAGGGDQATDSWELKNTLDKAERKTLELVQKNTQLETENNQLQKEIKILLEKKQKSDIEIQDVNSKLQDVLNSSKTNQSKNVELEKALDVRMVELQQVQEELKASQAKALVSPQVSAVDRSSVLSFNPAAEAREQQLQEKLSKLSEAHADVHIELATLKTKHAEVQQEVQQLKTEKEERETHSALGHTNVEEHEPKDLLAQHDALLQEHVVLTEKHKAYESLADDHVNLQEELVSVKEQHALLQQQATDDKNELVDYVTSLEKESTETLEKLSQDLADSELHRTQLQEAWEELTEDHNTVITELMSLKADLQKAESYSAQIESLQHENESLKNSHSGSHAAEMRLETLEESHTELLEKLTEIQERNNWLRMNKKVNISSYP